MVVHVDESWLDNPDKVGFGVVVHDQEAKRWIRGDSAGFIGVANNLSAELHAWSSQWTIIDCYSWHCQGALLLRFTRS